MKKNGMMILFALLLAGLFVLTQVLFIVREGEVAVVTSLGKPVRAVTEAGLYNRLPWPFHAIHTFDNRTHIHEGSFEETLTSDGKNILVSMFVGWRIADPIPFLERLGGVPQAESGIDGLLRTYKSAVIGRVPFSDLINTDPDAVKLEDIERDVLAAIRDQARDRYGLDIVFTGISRLGLPETITQSVFDRMRAERQELADRYRSEGQGEAIRIRAAADAERDRLLSEAEGKARRLRAEGDAAAAQYYQVFAEDPELAIFLKKLDVLRDTLTNDATVVLSSDTAPYDLLKSGDAKR